ncbi:hypothetical protein KAK07_23385 [Ideonella sp. 4Y16]|uniref:Uncharacterized protein n=2 Tax=Sphaerotilaceae TaxID=2975441 RepID=A0A940YKR2_9BURK|nr:hypothetical protein [Ideonella alba]MBQ0962000.1 hypothetical protein [Ideonella aquatica]
MAEAGSWPSIREHGLLSSNEVTRLSGATDPAATHLRRGHRAQKVPVDVPGIGTIVLRDQIPMEPARIQRALPEGVSAADWYELINERVFFWTAEERLHRLLNGRQYGHLEHDVLTLNTASLVAAHGDRIRLCHMNSGNTFPAMTRRGPEIFKELAAYEMNTRGHPRKPVVELTVLQGVPDIAAHVVDVRRMRGEVVLRQIPR